MKNKKPEISRVEKQYNNLIKKSKVKIKKGYRKFIYDKTKDRDFVRCQGTNSEGKQCSLKAGKGSLFCRLHTRSSRYVRKTKEVIKYVNKTMGLYGVKEKTFLDEELKQVDLLTPVELTDLEVDIKALTAIVNKLMKQEPKDIYRSSGRGKSKIKELVQTKEESAIKIAKSLQYSILNLANLKKIYYDVKFSDANTVPKDMFVYVLNIIKQIIQDEVKDIDVLRKIAERMKRMQVDVLMNKSNFR